MQRALSNCHLAGVPGIHSGANERGPPLTEDASASRRVQLSTVCCLRSQHFVNVLTSRTVSGQLHSPNTFSFFFFWGEASPIYQFNYRSGVNRNSASQAIFVLPQQQNTMELLSKQEKKKKKKRLYNNLLQPLFPEVKLQKSGFKRHTLLRIY